MRKFLIAALFSLASLSCMAWGHFTICMSAHAYAPAFLEHQPVTLGLGICRSPAPLALGSSTIRFKSAPHL